ncbi:N-acetyltransferase [Gordonia sp. zg691]|uniref:N-acetyltransferase n=1 Tax=Gordonia jinghuaiqii TaxID=2758710 RepID=A0A7D7QQS7_9ACTN|nr:GNAT family N-acetyltransferase [Gordonia jinghuaiqii]MBD0861853.1 N-acetyltransferase [Gordonia jinghuaiqii]MCR5977745.1 GNAT family N-acetyltransferase [Gordonia jinghuaiqii]QMT02406.1 N-acetyltransferase [Gordonia jinghuaiqii]
MADVGTLRFDHSPAQERYEAVLVTDQFGEDEVVGYVDYVSEPYQVVLTHTVVREQYSGKGYAAQLVRVVLEDIRGSGKQVVPVCSYVQRFIERHPEFADLAVRVPQ